MASQNSDMKNPKTTASETTIPETTVLNQEEQPVTSQIESELLKQSTNPLDPLKHLTNLPEILKASELLVILGKIPKFLDHGVEPDLTRLVLIPEKLDPFLAFTWQHLMIAVEDRNSETKWPELLQILSELEVLRENLKDRADQVFLTVRDLMCLDYLTWSVDRKSTINESNIRSWLTVVRDCDYDMASAIMTKLASVLYDCHTDEEVTDVRPDDPRLTNLLTALRRQYSMDHTKD